MINHLIIELDELPDVLYVNLKHSRRQSCRSAEKRGKYK